MIGEKFSDNGIYHEVAGKLYTLMRSEIFGRREKYVISIAGESGAGKSTIACGLAGILKKGGIKTLLIQQDDYFINPPITNYKLRRKNIFNVGLSEIKLSLLQEHVNKFRKSGTLKIRKPLVIFPLNIIWRETVSCRNVKVLIVEGTFVSLLKNIDKKVFMAHTYRDTKEGRLRRNREKVDKVSRHILGIEHKIISLHKQESDILIKKDYSVIEKGRGKPVQSG